jgi:3-deoxy-D-manno-octulosonate 8-phosphate phosphatase (KDO 8-P phosphatase)
MTAAALRARCRRLRVIVTDVDGVLTDGGMYYGESGEEMKRFNIRDGAGVALLKCAGLFVGAMTGESRDLVDRRAEKMGLDFLVSGARHKLGALERFATKNGFTLKEVAYLGDEINDCGLLGRVGVFFAVADAGPEVRRGADVVLKTRGGAGALREAAEIVLRHQGRLTSSLTEYLRLSAESGELENVHLFPSGRKSRARPVRIRKP